MDAVLYIHRKGGSASESEDYKMFFPDCELDDWIAEKRR